MVVVAMTGAFANVPRRRRSAGAAGTGASQEAASADDGDAAVACDKQTSSSSRSEAEHQDEKQGLQGEEPVAQNGGGDVRTRTSPRNGDGAVAPPVRSNEPVVPSSSSSAAARVKDAEELRRNKGKMLAEDQSLPEPTSRNNAGAAAAPPERPMKLLGDAIRCHGNSTGAAASKQPIRTTKSTGSSSSKKRKDRGAAFWFGMGGEGQSTSSAGSDMDLSLERIPVASALLRETLSNLSVAAPVRVYGKMMSRSDRTTQQARLLLSCKSWQHNNNNGDDELFPLDAFMTEEELAAAHGAGLHVLAYDRAGAQYGGMKCRYLASNLGYRVIGNWGHFLRGNGLVDRSSGGGAKRPAMDVLIDLWLFRCPKGELGIVFMHYRRGDAAHADAAFEEEDVVRMRKNRRREPAVDQVDSAAEDDGMEVDDEDVGEDDVAMQDEGAAGGNDVVMEDAAYDAVGGGGGGEASTLPSSDATGVTLVLEVTAGSQEEATVPLASSDANNVKAEKKDTSGPRKKLAAPSPPDARGANEEDEAGARGQSASPSPFNANDDAKAVEVHAPPSSDAGAKVEETVEQGRAAEPVSSLSGYKQEVIEAAKTLMLISQGFW